jgi:hypothetical protein
MAWVGTLIVSGAKFGGNNNRGIIAIYQDPPYGVLVPFIQNIMPKNAFKFTPNYVHFLED